LTVPLRTSAVEWLGGMPACTGQWIRRDRSDDMPGDQSKNLIRRGRLEALCGKLDETIKRSKELRELARERAPDPVPAHRQKPSRAKRPKRHS